MSAECGCACGSGADCGCDECCAGIALATPVSVANSPGQPRLNYRVGTAPQFVASMRARLASTEFPALAALTTRDPSDFSLALLDGWATVADVLTFYTERIANEGYLRTATEEFSVRRLAELVGYRPRPGLSATAYLAFTVAAGQTASIPIGTKAQQIPGPGQLPATFETAEPLVGHGHLSTLGIRRAQPQLLSAMTLPIMKKLLLAGNVTELRPGDQITVEVFGEGSGWALYEVRGVEFDATANKTNVSVKVEWPKPEEPEQQPGQGGGGVVIRNGHHPTRLESLVEALRKPPSRPPATSADLGRSVTDLLAPEKSGVTTLLADIVPGVAGSLNSALAHSSTANPAAPKASRLRMSAMLFGATAPKYPIYSAGSVVGYVDPKKAHDLETDVFHPAINPPNYVSRKTLDLDAVYPGILVNSEIVLINPDLFDVSEGAIRSPVAVRTVTAVSTVTDNLLGLSAKVTRLTLDVSWPFEGADRGDDGGGPPDLPLHGVLDNTTVLFSPQSLTLAGESIDDVDVGCNPVQSLGKRSAPLTDAGGPTCGDTLELDGLYPELEPGRWLIVSGERTDAAIKSAQDPDVNGAGATGVPGGELVMVAAVEHRPARIAVAVPGEQGAQDQVELIELPGDTVHTFVRLAAPLAFTYARPSVVIYGNIARATHGETRGEVLGGGDPTKPFARYPLKQPPLTYLPAPSASGAQSSLDVFVDSVRWQEADSLLDIGPDERRYVIDTDDDGNTAVIFGATRPPSGAENIRARYRSGIGTTGNAAALTIATPLDHVLGVTAVTNPLPATGGADPDGRETVRRNATASMQALDRLVSVSDYADFASAYAGVGAAAARELSDGRQTVVHVTIAGIDDAPIAPDADLTANLRLALRALGDPNQDVHVAVRTLKALVVSARVRIDRDRQWSDVEAAVRARLVATFGPGQRDIGRGIAQSEVLAAIHSVPGVIYGDMTIFDSIGEAQLVSADPAAGLTLRKLVRAALARFDNTEPGPGQILPAELVILRPSAPDTLILEAL